MVFRLVMLGLCLGLGTLALKGADRLDAWELEDAVVRDALPLYEVIPAADPDELTAELSVELPPGVAVGDWHRSHGNHSSDRFSSLDQIHRGNVADLTVAWIYRSNDGKGNIQCNPIAVDGTIYVPTVGEHVVALDGMTGIEKWRFKPEGRPAFPR